MATLPNAAKALIILNKIDLADTAPTIPEDYPHAVVTISAKLGEGLSELRRVLIQEFAPGLTGESPMISRTRHIQALEATASHVEQAKVQLFEFAAGELFAEELRLAHESLCEITGEFSSDDLLGEIFSSFCIGK